MNADETIVPALLFDRYRVEGTLGEGGLGSVVRAFDTRLRRTVAIKTLKRSFVMRDPTRLAALEDRFNREAIAGSRMGSHPNLVAVYDLITDNDGTLYLILEYVTGGTLAHHLRADGPLPPEEALRLTADIARGLQAAHEHGLVHRDIKPANIFLAGDGRAQVGDFGIAQIDDLSARTETTTSHPGTPLYMSPEQSRETGYLRPSSDQYSLGLTLYEMLTGAVYRKLEPADAATRLDALPRPLAALIERLTAENSSDRYLNMDAVLQAAQAIAAVMAFTPGGVTPAPPAPPQRRDTPPVSLQPADRVQVAPPGSATVLDAEPPDATVPYGTPLRAPAPAAPRRMGRRAVLVWLGGVVAAGAASGGYLLLGRQGTSGPDTANGGSTPNSGTPQTAAGTAPAASGQTTAAATPDDKGGATATLAPTPVPAPTFTPVPLPTFSPRAIVADMTDKDQWNTISVELSSRTLISDSYTVRVTKRPDGRGLLSWGDWRPKNVTLAPQFAAEVEMQLTGDALAVGGILFNFNFVSANDQQQFLLFLLRADGMFRIVQQQPGGEGHNIARLDWTPSAAIKRGAGVTNVPRVIVQDGTLTCGVNGQQVAQMPAPSELATFSAFGLAADIVMESTVMETAATFRNLRYEPFTG